MKKQYLLALDQGTTGSTAALIHSETLEFLGSKNVEFPQHYPAQGQVEHDLHEIWSSLEEATRKLFKEFSLTGYEILAIGLTNQRETTCAMDLQGNPLERAIVWQDRRTAKMCEELDAQGLSPMIKEKTGLFLDAYFSATKMKFFLDNSSKIQEARQKKNLRFGTIDTFMLLKLTSGESYKTEASNASRTMLMNLKTGEYDDELLKLFGLNKDELPLICDSFSEFGRTKNLSFLPDGIPITGILGDQQSALFGQGLHQRGQMKCTYGTGAFVLTNTGHQLIETKELITTVAYSHKGKLNYALEGSCFVAGAAIQYLRDNLHFFEKSSESEELALKADLQKINGLFFFPFFTGLGTPYWKSDARAILVGVGRETTPAEITYVTLESIAFSVQLLLETFAQELGKKPSLFKVDGGATENNLLMQLQSNLHQLPLSRPQIRETTSFGAALAAAKGLNLPILNGQRDYNPMEKTFTPQQKEDHPSFKEERYQEWKKLLTRYYL